MTARFDIVVAADEAGGIGCAGELPWKLPTDTAFLKRITTETRDPAAENAVVMGRVTFETIPPRFRPLKRRLNVVISRNPGYAAPAGVVVADGLDAAVAAAAPRCERIYVLGGGQIYRLAVAHPGCERIYLTRVEGEFPADAHFPSVPTDVFELTEESERHEENGIGFVFQTWSRRR